MRNSRPLLLIEDDSVDAMTVKRALKELGIPNKLEHVLNGEEAIDYLNNAESVHPGIILTDLNMPRMDGIEFMEKIKAEDDLRHIPVVVLTTSKEESDITRSFHCGAAGYLTKPVDFQVFVEIIQTLDAYWTHSELPGRKPGCEDIAVSSCAGNDW